ncbi:hypothetical protein C2R22_20505 [Salinigranum rubrum]|uniref:Uncharacterized protein n=1 Tax=Salinigranum rubrum TaxID=755307 RepID=A0A2I8VP85_9EURY|nr:hypothetical protein [Salinigranum rubrum]AUV83733.1 hypothetical protein C2R22_20505 [Salinigranum rubrum]
MGSVESVPGERSSEIGGRSWSPFGWLGRRSRTKNMGFVRLRADFEVYREEFDTLVSRAAGDGTFWERDVTDLLEKVEEALEAGRVEDGWRYFHAAQRLEIHGLEALDEREAAKRAQAATEAAENAADVERAGEPDALRTRARAIRLEALDTLGGWRKEAVEELLGADGLADDVTGEEVRAASKILHDQYEGVHLKRYYLQLQFNQLFWLGTLAGFVFVVLSILPYFDIATFFQPPFTLPVVESGETTQAQPVVTSAGFAVFVALSGMVGASLFGMRSLQKKRVSTKVAQRITGLAFTWARGLIGAISALVFYFFLQTPFVGDLGGITPALMIVVGFAAGYSERMVSRAVETVSGATTDAESD